jgi:hypothetical protein
LSLLPRLHLTHEPHPNPTLEIRNLTLGLHNVLHHVRGISIVCLVALHLLALAEFVRINLLHNVPLPVKMTRNVRLVGLVLLASQVSAPICHNVPQVVRVMVTVPIVVLISLVMVGHVARNLQLALLIAKPTLIARLVPQTRRPVYWLQEPLQACVAWVQGNVRPLVNTMAIVCLVEPAATPARKYLVRQKVFAEIAVALVVSVLQHAKATPNAQTAIPVDKNVR